MRLGQVYLCGILLGDEVLVHFHFHRGLPHGECQLADTLLGFGLEYPDLLFLVYAK